MNERQEFDVAQALRKSHCDRSGHEHECVGEMTIRRGEVSLKCQLCGSGEQIPGWNADIARRLRAAFRAAGIHWDNLHLDAQIEAIKAYQREKN